MSFAFEFTTDPEEIRRVLTHPKVWRHVTDDFAAPPECFEPVFADGILYLKACDSAELLGIWMFVQHNRICWEIHTALLPNAYGVRADAAAKEMLEWLWRNTACRRLITNVPRTNRLALHFAKRAGMIEFGVNSASYQKHGTLQDQILLGISAPLDR